MVFNATFINISAISCG